MRAVQQFCSLSLALLLVLSINLGHAQRINREICDQPLSVGYCRDSLTRYFYNRVSRTCVQFTYSGCGGNTNNFNTESDCRDTCIQSSGAGASSSSSADCQLAASSGPCGGRLTKYFYNTDSGACEQFTYSGCMGNANRFDDVESCRAACAGN